jgi:hypothetical protein
MILRIVLQDSAVFFDEFGLPDFAGVVTNFCFQAFFHDENVRQRFRMTCFMILRIVLQDSAVFFDEFGLPDFAGVVTNFCFQAFFHDENVRQRVRKGRGSQGYST